VARLSLRAASLLAEGARPNAPPSHVVSPLEAIADAVARCSGADAERALRAFLSGDRTLARAAAIALGSLATRRGRLEDESVVALLDAASAKPALEEALYPFSRTAGLGETARERLLGVVRATLSASTSPSGRSFALRALGATGDAGANELGLCLNDPKTATSDRADAARTLARMSGKANGELYAAAEKLFAAPESTAKERLESAEYGVLESVLYGLSAPQPESAWLSRLAALPLSPASPTLNRRSVRLRCRAASLTANPRKPNPALEACDPDPKGRLGRLARLEVLGRAPLRGGRLAQFRELAASDDVVVRERALELLADQSEVRDAFSFFTRALGSKAPGEVATAASVLHKHPGRAGASPETASEAAADANAAEIMPDPALVNALLAAIASYRQSHNVEVTTALFDAAAALKVLGAKPALEAACQHANPTLRTRAEAALRTLGERDRACNEFEPDTAAPAELASLLREKQRLSFETEAGALYIDLDPELAPVAVSRAVTLAQKGFYDAHAIHRVVPGFVVQFGDPGGDGYGGANLPPLRCETAPAPFEVGAVGVALSGRDTGSSQLFVTLGRHPHLDGNYALVGQASPGWDRLAEGDRIIKVRVEPAR
jgi:cyclophilin family peptidyl-prolyl cis-trans isomerase